jgi:hypothetical protein
MLELRDFSLWKHILHQLHSMVEWHGAYEELHSAFKQRVTIVLMDNCLFKDTM